MYIFALILFSLYNSYASPLQTVQTALRLQTARRRVRSNVKKPPHNSVKGSGGGGGSSSSVKTGCRCGNATATPGKLTCCGQRCPCYIDSKACTDCKCRGCRNPHTSDGHKVSLKNSFFNVSVFMYTILHFVFS